MTAKVDQISVVEPNNAKMSATNTPSGVSSTGSKVSMFAAKSGFVIPKNKLSGSMVPVFRGGKRPGGNDTNKEESANQVQRKTKWGPDLTQDTVVRRGRALAYQTRVDQIAEQLKSGVLESGGNQNLQVADEFANSKSSNSQIDNKSSELEIERREAIGEILKLSPSYKAPPDYKPLLKEAKVPLPVKENPGFNFVSLIFGPGNETLQRLEKETGAKIHLYGTKAITREKAEISPSDGNEIQVGYEELIVHVSAETFEEVDAAVSLLELLITSVSGSLAVEDKSNLSQDASRPFMVPNIENQELEQPLTGPVQTSQQGQFQYQSTWFQTVAPQAPVDPTSNFTPPQTYSAPVFNNPVHAHSSSLNPLTMPSLFGPQTPTSGFNSMLQNSSPARMRLQPMVQAFPNKCLPRNFPMPASQPSSAQANNPTPLAFPSSLPQPTGLSSIVNPLNSSLPQLMPTVPPQPQSNGPLNPIGSSMGWSGSALGPVSMGQTNPMFPLPGPRPVVPRPGFPLAALPSNISAALSSTSVTPSQGVSLSTLRPVPSSAQVMDGSLLPNPSRNPLFGSAPINLPMTPPSQPMVATPNSQHSGPGDFTFQARHPLNSASQTLPRLSSQHVGNPNSMLPQSPSFHFAMPNLTPQLGMHTFPRPQAGNLIHQAQHHTSAVPFAGNNHMNVSVSPRFPSFSNAGPAAAPGPVLQMGLRNFSPTPRSSNLAGPLNSRPGNPMQLQQNFPAAITPLGNFMPPNHPLNKNPSFASRPVANPGGQQIYDPFSPTSVSIASQQQAGNAEKTRKQENDPEYEDLMASVGVK